MLAGVYISFGGLVSLVALNEGMGRIAAGTVFSVGLVYAFAVAVMAAGLLILVLHPNRLRQLWRLYRLPAG